MIENIYSKIDDSRVKSAISAMENAEEAKFDNSKFVEVIITMRLLNDKILYGEFYCKRSKLKKECLKLKKKNKAVSILAQDKKTQETLYFKMFVCRKRGKYIF